MLIISLAITLARDARDSRAVRSLPSPMMMGPAPLFWHTLGTQSAPTEDSFPRIPSDAAPGSMTALEHFCRSALPATSDRFVSNLPVHRPPASSRNRRVPLVAVRRSKGRPSYPTAVARLRGRTKNSTIGRSGQRFPSSTLFTRRADRKTARNGQGDFGQATVFQPKWAPKARTESKRRAGRTIIAR
jgi:hypothetical protein